MLNDRHPRIWTVQILKFAGHQAPDVMWGRALEGTFLFDYESMLSQAFHV